MAAYYLTHMSVSDDEFRSALRSWASGVTVITTTETAGAPAAGSASRNGFHHGMTASSFTSVSLSPPLVSVCVDDQAETLPFLRQSGRFAINVLSVDQAEVSNRFASREESDRFDGQAFTVGVGGCALLDAVAAHIECAVEALHVAGDHVIVVGRVLRCNTFERAPLLYRAGSYGTFTPSP